MSSTALGASGWAPSCLEGAGSTMMTRPYPRWHNRPFSWLADVAPPLSTRAHQLCQQPPPLHDAAGGISYSPARSTRSTSPAGSSARGPRQPRSNPRGSGYCGTDPRASPCEHPSWPALIEERLLLCRWPSVERAYPQLPPIHQFHKATS
ncbi:hypothetical protein BS78_05G090700 [Paspalum vaginatum]|nr:hypothetical protein BS78_05G090700 [Paspalum vaginatum]KAJ1274833.1 hypothetical protein BS78_05G090700 [Paspalum vaginatum]